MKNYLVLGLILAGIVLVSGCVQKEPTRKSIEEILKNPIDGEKVKVRGYLHHIRITSGINCLNADYVGTQEFYQGPGRFIIGSFDNKSVILVRDDIEYSPTAGAPIYYSGAFYPVEISGTVKIYHGPFNLLINNKDNITCTNLQNKAVIYISMEKAELLSFK